MSDNNNFKPNLEGYKPLRPFNLFMKNNFPFIENTIEALDTYGLLCEIVKYLNVAIENVNTTEENINLLNTAFDQLNDYVSHYFDNLDVQEEINNKLDSMVQSGELQSLLTGQYQALRTEVNASIDSLENQVNNQLNNFESQVNASLNQFDTRISSVASGSPLKASSTDEMIDTSRIYVNTTDGYWYYYNGSSWTQGGVYQSTTLGDGVVHYTNFDASLKNSFTGVSAPITLNDMTFGLVNADGSITTSTSIAYYEISVNTGEQYKAHVYYSGFGDSNVAIQFLNNSTVVSNILKSGITLDEDNFMNETFIIPNGVNKVKINGKVNVNNLSVGNYIEKITSFKMYKIEKNQLDEKLQNIFTNVYTEVTPTLFIENAMMVTGSNKIVAYPSGRTRYSKCNS